MYAIVDIAGQQFKVEKDQEIFVHRLEGEEGSKVKFNDVLLLDDDGKVSVGTPLLKGVSISAKILSHEKADKIKVFHKKRRKGYQKENGHRQDLSKILVESIAATETAAKKETAKKAAPKKEAVKKEEAPKAEAKKTATKKAESKAKAAPKAAAAKKETVKKAAPKKAAAPKAKKEATATKKEAPKAKAKASTKKADKE